jgi:hypothetical protein
MTSGCRTRFDGPTDCFASPHQARNHPPRDIFAEAISTLVDKDDPMRNFGRLIHEFVDSVGKYWSSRDITWVYDVITHKFHTPVPCSNSLSEYIN